MCNPERSYRLQQVGARASFTCSRVFANWRLILLTFCCWRQNPVGRWRLNYSSGSNWPCSRTSSPTSSGDRRYQTAWSFWEVLRMAKWPFWWSRRPSSVAERFRLNCVGAGSRREPRNSRSIFNSSSVTMGADNPTWGEARIADRLRLKWAFESRRERSEIPEGGPSTGRTPDSGATMLIFVRNHARAIVDCDFSWS